MNRTKLPIKEIQVIDRQRLELGDIPELAASIKQFGLIQPIVVNQDKRLIAGGRRLAAFEYLKLEEIDVVYKETLSIDQLHMLELEENIKRREMSWQERSLNILKIHELQTNTAAIESRRWGMQETAEMLGLRTKASVSYNNEIAKRLRIELTLPIESRQYWSCENMSKAWQLRLREEEELLQAELSKETAIATQVNIIVPEPKDKELSLDDLLALPDTQDDTKSNLILLRQTPYLNLTYDQAKLLYLSNSLNPINDFDAYYIEKVNYLREKLNPLKVEQINILSRLHHGSCIDYMLSRPESVDHIITDPPYGIDMDMLNQGNDGHAFQDIDTVLEEHTVKGNEELFVQFFPAAFTALKPQGFLILWGDQMQWQYQYDLAIKAGFKVQRWPITWVKTHRCMNQSINQNFTKTTEIAMVCRKGTASLSTQAQECHIIEPHDDYKDELGHPFVKPFNVWKYLIEHVSYEGQTILEPFSGRGSGVISIARLKRQFIACELNEKHYNALVENVKQHYLKINPNYTFI